MTWISELIYCVSVSLVKASLLALYLHLSPSRAYRSLSYIALVLVAGHFISGLTVTAFQCTPVPYLWDKTIKGRCIQTGIFYFINAGLNVFTDVLIFALPMPMLWGIGLPKRQKLGLCVVFSLGALQVTLLQLKHPGSNYNAELAQQAWSASSTLAISLTLTIQHVSSPLPYIPYPN